MLCVFMVSNNLQCYFKITAKLLTAKIATTSAIVSLQNEGRQAGLVISTVTSQKGGPGFKSQGWQFYLCMCGFLLSLM